VNSSCAFAVKSNFQKRRSLQSCGASFAVLDVSHAIPILVLNLPPTHFTLSVDKATGGAFLNWGDLVMGIVYRAHNKQDRLDESPPRGDESTDVLSLLEENARLRGDESPLWDDEHTDDVLSLLEENARLRGLVVKLSNLILKNVADRR
jgi:hypothetical protein